MKYNPLKTLVLLPTVMLAMQTYGQSTGLETLETVMSNTNAAPLNLYPQGYFDWLEAVGTNQLPSAPTASQRPVRDVPVTPLIADDISLDGGFGMMAMSRPAPSDSAPSYTYTITDLGTLGGSSSAANSINNNGQVAGNASNGSQINRPALFTSPVTDLGTFGGSDGLALGINPSGKIVGAAAAANNLNHAFMWDGSMHDLGTLGGQQSAGYGINSSGQITGIGQIPGDIAHAMLYSAGTMSDLGTFPSWSGAYGSIGYGIDDAGDIGGTMATNGSSRGFLKIDGTMQDIGTLGGNDAAVYAINSYAEVVGYSTTTGGDHHAMFYDYQDGTMEDLGVLSGATSSDAWGVNNSAHVVGSSGGHAFLVSNGSMQDLNNLVINNGSGWTLQYALGINDKDQIVGYGTNPNGQTHAYLLTPLPLGWQNNIVATTLRQSFANIESRPTGITKLIVVTHGRIPPGDDPDASTAWVDSMVTTINSYLIAHSLNDWAVIGYKWKDGASHFIPDTVLNNAKQQGVGLGLQIVSQGYTHVHFIAHSAGAGLIQEATDIIKKHNSSIVVHETFLDPYVGSLAGEANKYGVSADWAENYFTRDQETDLFGDTFPFTDFIMPNTYNVEVTQLDVNDRVQRKYFVTAGGAPCYKTKSGHIWPVNFYMNTLTGSVSSDYQGYGFPLGEEGTTGQWNYAKANYLAGNGIFGNPTPVKQLGTPDPACFLDIPAPTYPSATADFINSPTVVSTTGTIDKYPNGSVKHSTGSPAWLATFITITNPVNVVAFDAEFQSATGAQGLLSVYWDSNTVGTVDERMMDDGFQHYTFKVPLATDGVHMLGFRLDPFTNIQSVIVLTNVITTASGVTQPFSLAVVGSTNGMALYQLNGQPGFEYSVQASTNLTSGWTNIASLINTNGTVRFYDEDATNYPQRFYRAVAPF